MRAILRSVALRGAIVWLAPAAGACSSDASPAGGASSTHGDGAGDTGAPPLGASSSGGSSGGPVSGSSSGGSSGGMPTPPGADSGATPDAASGTTAEASTGPTPDADSPADASPADASFGDDSDTPMGSDSGPQPSYDGEIPIYYGPDPGPVVQMQCPGDPTQGWTEYKDSFHVEHPYNLPTNARFSIIGGIYNYWVFPDDFPHSPTAMGRNPRTEAHYGGVEDAATGGTFQTGLRMYSADMLIERNAIGSAIMQIHTNATGGGPIGVRIEASGDMINNGSLTVVQGSSVPGGLIDTWFNYKATLDTKTLQVKIYVNNCLKSTFTGTRGDGNFYFKNGVYFCKTSQNGCFSHYKNIHLYKM